MVLWALRVPSALLSEVRSAAERHDTTVSGIVRAGIRREIAARDGRDDALQRGDMRAHRSRSDSRLTEMELLARGLTG
jgi:hypothetical protein